MYSALTDQAILYKQQRLASLLDAESIGYFYFGADGLLQQVNATAANILGIERSSEESARHVNSIDRFIGLGLAAEFEQILAGDREFEREEVECTNRHGRYMNLSCRCTRDRSGDGSGVVGIIRETNSTNSTKSFGSDELEILTHVATALSSSHDLHSILRTILIAATASQGLGFNRAFLLLFNKETNMFDGYLAVGPESAEDAGKIWRQLAQQEKTLDDLLGMDSANCSLSDKHLSERVQRTSISLSESQSLQSLYAEEQWAMVDVETTEDQPLRKLFRELRCEHAAIVPVRSRGGTEGLLIADNLYSKNPICEDSVHMLLILANQAAIVLKQTRLIDDLKARAEQLTLANRRLNESQDQLIRFEKLSVIGELTSAVAHELRNPLTVIGGFANLMLRSNCTEGQKEYLQIISTEIKRTEQVLDQVLDFSKASKSERALVDFSDLAEKSLSLLIGRLSRRDLELPLQQTTVQLPVYVNCDQVSHALFNIFKLVAEELTPPFVAVIRTERENDMATLRVSFSPGQDERGVLVQNLQRMFSERANSQRLSILVAGETIRLYGGDITIAGDAIGGPAIVIQIPLVSEDKTYD